MSNKKHKNDDKDGVSRREFVRLMGMATGAVAAGSALPLSSASASAAKSTKTALPKVAVKHLNKTAEEIYHAKPDLSRFHSKNMAFKQVSRELGVPFYKPQIKNLMKEVKNSRIGPGVSVKNPDEARVHVAFSFGGGTWNNMTGPYGEGHENMGQLSWTPLHVPKDLYTHPLRSPDPQDLTKKIKQMARIYGADMTGVTKINKKWIYDGICRNMTTPETPETKSIVFKKVKHPSETQNELIIPECVENAIVFVVAMPRAANQLDPATATGMGATGLGYGRMGLTAVAIAEAIRAMGYNAIPCMNDTGLSVPMAIDAGLGQLGRLGYLITPWFGPHVRLAKVLTDMPLVPDVPIDFGVTEFCEKCGICAKACPSGAISPDRKRSFAPPLSAGNSGNPGALKWYADGKKCLRWWVESGSVCSKCMNVCPYTKKTWTNYYDGTPSPDKFWDVELGPFGYKSVTY